MDEAQKSGRVGGSRHRGHDSQNTIGSALLTDMERMVAETITALMGLQQDARKHDAWMVRRYEVKDR
jgi:hypothetical protein